MGVRVVDFKNDGEAWIVIHRNGKRTTQRIGDWEEARSLAKEIETELQREQAGLPRPIPIRQVLEGHERFHVRTLKHSTQVLQRGQIHNHLIPALGDIDVRDLTEAHVSQFIEGKLQELSPSFVRGCVNVLRKALNRLRRTSPDIPNPHLELDIRIFERAETSRAQEIREVDSWTFEDGARMLGIVCEREPRFYPIVLTLLHTGCRRGEALGMQWQDVDFKRKRIAIRRARVRSRTVLPKHRRRNDPPRYVVITPAMEDALKGLSTFRYRKSGGWVFATKNGTPIQETTLARAWNRIKILLAARGVRTLTMHSLRHTFATLSLESGKSVKWVSQQLGHKDAGVTLNTYAHALPDEESDLSYLPISGDVTGRHQDVTRYTQKKDRNAVSG